MDLDMQKENGGRVLLLEDDLSLTEGLSFALKKQGFEPDTARTVADAKKLWSEGKYSLLILDVSLPDGTGFEFCRYVRQSSRVPIIFLTASDEEINVVMGLDIGGDDYITKPFKLGVLMSRINALMRRAGAAEKSRSEICSNGIKVDLAQGRVTKNDEPLELTGAEFRLLCLFMQNPNAVLTKDQILYRLWDSAGNFVDDNTLSVYIRRLRVKIEDDPEQPRMFVSVRGMGYKWSVTA